MLRFAVKLALAAAAAWAVFGFVPLRGRTLADRWHAAGGFVPFVERGWVEVTGAPARQARSSPSRDRPTEGHTAADRRALDRILSERLAERR